jgi:two-component system, sensor histidine kinase PdtaS
LHHRFIFLILLGVLPAFFFAQEFNKEAFVKQFNTADFKEKVKLVSELGTDELAQVYPMIKDSLLRIKQRVYYKTSSNEAKFLFDLIDARREINDRQYHKTIFLLENSLRFHTKDLNDSVKVFALLSPSYIKLRNYNKAFEIDEVMERNKHRLPKEVRYQPKKSYIYMQLGMLKESTRELRKEFNMKTPEQRTDTSTLGNFYNDMGVHFNRANKLDSAMAYFNKAKVLVDAKMRTEENRTYFDFFSGLIDGNIASALAKQKMYAAAIPPLKKDIYYSLKAKNYLSAANSYNLIAECYLNEKQFDLARRNIDSAKALMPEIEELAPQLNNILVEAKYYKNTGNLLKASESYDKYIEFKDSITRVDNESKLISQQVTFDLYQKENMLIEKQNIIQKNKLIEEHARSQKAYFTLGIVLLLFVVAFLTISVQMNKRRNNELYLKNKHIIQQKTVIEEALKEKEFLMKEIHHRVKNNLQIVSSMLSLQSDKISNDSAKLVLQEGRQRINSMALIHQLLYNQNSMSFISISNYISTLAEQIEHTYRDPQAPVKVNIQCDEIKMDLDTAIPLGLIVNELITNAYKHAFKKEQDRVIELRLVKEAERSVLTVKDNGAGFDYASQKQGLGMELISILVDQIGGKIEFQRDGGSAAVITF